MVIELKTTPEKYFHQLVEIFRFFPPFNQLRKRQREVFAEILYYNHRFSKESLEVRNRLLFDQVTRDNISTRLGISKANLYNIYKELRQQKLLVRDEINPKYAYKYMHHNEVCFRFQPQEGVQ